MATKQEDIWNEVKSIITTAIGSGSLTYVKELVEGARNDLPVFPVIAMVPARDTEARHTVPRFIRVTFDITIQCWIEVYMPSTQITGEASNKGILDIVRDVKNLLSAYPDLNGKALKHSFPATIFSWDLYPYWSADITMMIEYIAQDTDR